MDLILSLLVIGVVVAIVCVAAFVSVRNAAQRTPRLDQPSGVPSDPYQDSFAPTQPFSGSTYPNPLSFPGVVGDQILLRSPNAMGQVLPGDPTTLGPPPPPPGTTGLFIRAVRRPQGGVSSPTAPLPANTSGIAGLTIQAIRRRDTNTPTAAILTSPVPAGIRVNQVRRNSATLAVPTEMGSRITCPPSLTILYNQKSCRICGDTIQSSYSLTGWARCLQTQRLVHGHCYNAYKNGETWCGICDAGCRSGQAMQIEGVIA